MTPIAREPFWPTINIIEKGHPVVVDGFLMVFFLDRRVVSRDAEPVVNVIAAFLRGLGRGKLNFYVDENGDTPPLPPDPSALLEEQVVQAAKRGEVSAVTLLETDGWGGRFEVKYHCDPERSPKWPDERAYLFFRVDQGRVLEDGISPVVSFVQSASASLPWSYAYGTPALAYGQLISKTHQIIHRHPGFDVALPSACAMDIDARPLGAYWLNMFGAETTRALGGAEELAGRIPEARVLPAGGGGTLLLLGEAPDVGDVNRGNNLPVYRKLAQILEPMLKVPRVVYLRDQDEISSVELQEAWHRRFLTP